MIVLKPSMGPLAHEDLNPEIYSPDPELSEIRPGFELKSFSIFFFCEVVSLSLHGSSTGTIENCVAVWVSPEMDRQAVARCDKRSRVPPLQLRWYHQYPVHFFQQQIQAGFLPHESTPALAKDFPTLAHTVWGSG